MNRRIVAAIIAVVLAGLGTTLLGGYVAGADRRAAAGMVQTPVLVAAAPIPAGTPASALGELVTTKELPAKSVTPGALTELDQVAGQEVVADIQLGEQLVPARFAAPAEDAGAVEVPEDMHELSVLLEPRRVLGGHLTAGDTVGVFVSFGENFTDGRTHLTLHKVLVTRVQGGLAPAEGGQQGSEDTQPEDGAAPAPGTAPADAVVVTLALSPGDAEKVVWAQEWGTTWLSVERDTVPEDGTSIVTKDGVFK